MSRTITVQGSITAVITAATKKKLIEVKGSNDQDLVQ